MKRSEFRLLILAFYLFVPGILLAQVGIKDSLDLESFLDGTIETNLGAHHIAGVTVSVVKDNQLFFSKGYGFANVKGQEEVDPSNTLFRIGSISKLFVWTAVMQLAEQGKVDLDANINQYLNHFQIPDTYEEPITLKHLMTHSAGFEEYVLNLFSTDSLPPESLESIFIEQMPERVRPPGTFSSYSNHGTGLAAYIVEQVSGLKWDDYVEQNIFMPLGMTQSTFRQPLPSEFKTNHSEGYTYQGGEYQPAEIFKTIPLAPVGVASTTAHDIVPFMIAHLQKGQFGDNRILDSITAEQMHTPLFQHSPKINGMCYGFFDHSKNGHKIIGHGGATEYFFSMMLLFPEHGAGIFVSTNTIGGMTTAINVTDAFTDRYFPRIVDSPETIQLSKDYLKQFEGNYLTNRRPHNRILKIAAMVFDPVYVSVSEEKYLKTSGDPARFWEPIDSLTFIDRNSDRILAFRRNEQSEVTYAFTSTSPHTALERIPPSLSAEVHVQLFGGAFTLIILSLIIWGFKRFYQWRYRITDQRSLPGKAKFVAVINGVVVIIFFLAFSAIVGEGNDFIFRKRNVSDYLLFSLPLISLVLTLWQALKSVQVLKLPEVRFRSKLLYLLLTIGFLSLMWQAYFWNFLGFQF